MSFAQRAIAEGEQKREASIRVALMAGDLIQCDQICGQVFEQHSEETRQSAYKIGNSLISKGDPAVVPFKDTPEDRKELSAILENLWTDFPNKCKCQSVKDDEG
jgi:hypothetical protein